jgi:uncharacterized protein YndB with AHSA1/START domain
MTPTQTMKENPQALSLQLRRVIKGSRQRVFEAWTKPELLRQWFGPATRSVAEVSSDLRVNGAFRIVMEGDSANCAPPPEAGAPPRRPVATGKYTEIVPYERLSFTWRGDWGDMGDTLVTLEFNEVAGGTEVVLTHTNFTNREVLEGHNKGWKESLDKLARFIES